MELAKRIKWQHIFLVLLLLITNFFWIESRIAYRLFILSSSVPIDQTGDDSSAFPTSLNLTIIVITLDPLSEKMRNFNKTWSPFGRIEVFIGIEKDSLDGRYRYVGPEEVEDNRMTSYAVALTHLLVVKMAYNKQYDSVLILEDDARLDYAKLFPEVFDFSFTYHKFLKKDIDILMLYSCFGSFQRENLTKYQQPYFGIVRDIHHPPDILWHPRGYVVRDWGAVAYFLKPIRVQKMIEKHYCKDPECSYYEVNAEFPFSDWILYRLEGVKTNIAIPSPVSHKHPFFQKDGSTSIHTDETWAYEHNKFQYESHLAQMDQIKHFQHFVSSERTSCNIAKTEMLKMESRYRSNAYECQCEQAWCDCRNDDLPQFAGTSSCFLSESRRVTKIKMVSCIAIIIVVVYFYRVRGFSFDKH